MKAHPGTAGPMGSGEGVCAEEGGGAQEI